MTTLKRNDIQKLKWMVKNGIKGYNGYKIKNKI